MSMIDGSHVYNRAVKMKFRQEHTTALAVGTMIYRATMA